MNFYVRWLGRPLVPWVLFRLFKIACWWWNCRVKNSANILITGRDAHSLFTKWRLTREQDVLMQTRDFLNFVSRKSTAISTNTFRINKSFLCKSAQRFWFLLNFRKIVSGWSDKRFAVNLSMHSLQLIIYQIFFKWNSKTTVLFLRLSF